MLYDVTRSREHAKPARPQQDRRQSVFSSVVFDILYERYAIRVAVKIA